MDQVYRATLPEIFHTLKGWTKTHGVDEDPEKLSKLDLQELEEKVRDIHRERGHTLVFGKQE